MSFSPQVFDGKKVVPAKGYEAPKIKCHFCSWEGLVTEVAEHNKQHIPQARRS